MSARLVRIAVRVAAGLVPPDSRARWREEWLGEIATRGRPVSTCLVYGVLRDALAMRSVARARARSRRWPSRSRLRFVSSVDVKLALRVMRRTPVVTTASVLALAVGLGLTLAAWTVVRGVFYLPLPGPHGTRIMRLADFDLSGGFALDVRVEELERRRAALTSFEDVGGFHERRLRWGEGARAELRTAAFVTPNTMAIIGVTPIAGRDFTSADAMPGAPAVALVREPIAVDAFGSLREAIGRSVALDGRPHTVVGVIPEGCRFPFISDIWIPLSGRTASGAAPEQAVRMFGRLRAGVTETEAAAELDAVARSGRAPADHQDVVALVGPFGRPPGTPEQEYAAWAFVSAVGMLLLVAAANVAHLVLARAAARRDELLIRSALGASRARLAVQLALEGITLGVAAALVGAAGTVPALRWLRVAIPDLPYWVHFDLDLDAVLVMAMLALVVSTVIALVPVLRITGRGEHVAMTRTASPVRFGRLSSTLIATEIAAAVGLLCGAAVIGQALFRFGAHEVRLPASEVLVAQIYYGAPPESRMPEWADWSADRRRAVWHTWSVTADRRQRALVEDLGRLDGVRAVARATHLPGNVPDTARVDIGGLESMVTTRVVGADATLLSVLDAEPLAGRGFTRQDIDSVAPVAIVNQRFVTRHLTSGPVLGRRLRFVGDDGSPGPWLEVVGVVPDLGLNPGAPSQADGVYVPLEPATVVRLAVRTTAMPGAASRIHELASAGSPAATVQWTATLSEQLRETRFLYRGLGYALTALGLVALLLACTGIHAIVSLAVSERRREIAVRVALGAGPGRVARAVLASTAMQLAAGCLAGTALAFGVERAFALTPFDLEGASRGLLLLAVVLLGTAGLAACLKPLRQALDVRPAEWLK